MDLRSLHEPLPPPPELKGRVMQQLKARGRLRSSRPRWLTLAAALGLFAVYGLGVFTGRRVPQVAAEPRGERYALLLYQDSSFVPAASDEALVNEYRAWAVQLRRSGLQVGSEYLEWTAGRLLPRGTNVAVEPGDMGDMNAEPGELTGFFIVSAASDSAAVLVARSCPHLRHGGRVVVRHVASADD